MMAALASTVAGTWFGCRLLHQLVLAEALQQLQISDLWQHQEMSVEHQNPFHLDSFVCLKEGI